MEKANADEADARSEPPKKKKSVGGGTIREHIFSCG